MAEDNTDTKSSNQMWGGRFASGPDAIMEEINASIGFDKKLFAQDIRGSIAHATMLAHQGIISADDKDKIVHGLNTILSEIESGNFEFSRQLEDIHMPKSCRSNPTRPQRRSIRCRNSGWTFPAAMRVTAGA